MNQFDRALSKAEEETAPQLHVVVEPNGAAKKGGVPVPLRVLSAVKARGKRPELVVLSWEHRERRLAGCH